MSETKEQQEAEETPTFNVGDRIVLRGLKAAHLNGMHGNVATAATAATGRCGVDLDLILPDKGRIMIKPSNLTREAPIPEDNKRADVSGGSLVESEGRPCSCLLNYVRFIVATEFMPQDDIQSLDDLYALHERGGPREILRQNQLVASGWSLWNDPGGFHGVNPGGVYASVRTLVREELPEQNGPVEKMFEVDPSFRMQYDAVEDDAAVKGWNVRVTGHFWICGMDEAGTYLIPQGNLGHVYQCAGVRDPIWTKLPVPRRFTLMRLTMIPWYGRLVYDGVLLPPDGCAIPPIAADNKHRQLEEAVDTAKREGRVVSRLAQLEVEGGSRKGVHDHVVKTESARSNQQNSAPTAEEKKLVRKISNFPQDQTPDRDPSSWVFRRAGYTEYENPQHVGLILSSQRNEPGMLLGNFECSALIPTSLDILRALLRTVKRIGKRPRMLGIDDRACCDRVQSLLEDQNVSGTKTFYYAPPTPEETAAMMALGEFGGMGGGMMPGY